MTYTEIVRYANVITKRSELAKDIVHDFYLNLHKQGIDMFKIPKNFVYLGLSRTWANYCKRYVKYKLDYCINQIDKTKTSIHLDEESNQGEIEIIDNAPTSEQQIISKDIVDSCRKNIKMGYWDDYHAIEFKEYKDIRAKQARKAARKFTSDNFLQVFDFYAKGLYTTDIAKEMGVSQQYVNHFKYRIQKWIKPILKE